MMGGFALAWLSSSSLVFSFLPASAPPSSGAQQTRDGTTDWRCVGRGLPPKTALLRAIILFILRTFVVLSLFWVAVRV